MREPEAIIEVRFKTTAEGGRRGAIFGKDYRCPLFVDGEAFDCRIPLDGKVLLLGETYELPVRFLFPNLALPMLSLGKLVALWEGKEIAVGKVVRLTQSKQSD